MLQLAIPVLVWVAFLYMVLLPDEYFLDLIAGRDDEATNPEVNTRNVASR